MGEEPGSEGPAATAGPKPSACSEADWNKEKWQPVFTVVTAGKLVPSTTVYHGSCTTRESRGSKWLFLLADSEMDSN